jgi:hypothetical protein
MEDALWFDTARQARSSPVLVTPGQAILPASLIEKAPVRRTKPEGPWTKLLRSFASFPSRISAREERVRRLYANADDLASIVHPVFEILICFFSFEVFTTGPSLCRHTPRTSDHWSRALIVRGTPRSIGTWMLQACGQPLLRGSLASKPVAPIELWAHAVIATKNAVICCE